MTRDERVKVLQIWCDIHPCDSKLCRIYKLCQQYPSGGWSKQPDEVIDKVYGTLLEGEDLRKEEAENRLQQAEEQLGFKFNMPQCDEVTKMINERGDQKGVRVLR